MPTSREVNIVLNFAKGGSAEFADIFKGASGFSEPLKKLGENLAHTHDEINKLGIALDPEAIKATAAAEIKLAEARQKYSAALAAEKERIAPTVSAAPEGFLSRMMKGMSGGKEGGAGTAAIVQSVAGGGIGGLASGAMAAAGPWGMAASAVIDSLKSMTSAALDFAGKANPASAERVNIAIEDMQATIGRVFVPVLDQVGAGFRLMGDVLATLLPSTSQAAQVFAPVNEALGEARVALGEMAPVLKIIGGVVMQQVAIWVRMATTLVRVALALSPVVQLLGALGGAMGGNGQLSSSFGAAARTASYTGVSDIGKNAAAALYAGPMSADPATASAGYLGSIDGAVKEILAFLKNPVKKTVEAGRDAVGATDAKKEHPGITRAIGLFNPAAGLLLGW